MLFLIDTPKWIVISQFSTKTYKCVALFKEDIIEILEQTDWYKMKKKMQEILEKRDK